MVKRDDFSHLSLPLVVTGRPKIKPAPMSDERTKLNKFNRINHGGYIKRKTAELSKFWKDRQEERVREKLPVIKTGIPILLEIDPSSDMKFLKGLGFEIISEHENGYVIVSNGDNDFALFNKKTEDFINEVNNRCNTPARVYKFHEEESRFEKIFGIKLLSIWSTIEDDQTYDVDVSISCSGNIFEIGRPPKRLEDISEEEYKESEPYKKWLAKYYAAYEEWDDLKYQRESQFSEIVNPELFMTVQEMALQAL